MIQRNVIIKLFLLPVHVLRFQFILHFIIFYEEDMDL